jgi:hypothetical protein
MAKLYSKNGTIIRFIETDVQEAMYGAPADADTTIEFDPDTNAETIAEIKADWNAHAVADGKLTRSGIPVIIAPSSTLYDDRKALATIRDGLKTYYQLTSPTAAQTAQATKAIIRVLGIILDHYLKNVVTMGDRR